MFDTPQAALEALTDSRVLERVAVAVLRERGAPGLRITSPTGDLGRDGFQRPWFGEHEDTVLLVSCEQDWSGKLRRDLAQYLERPRDTRPPVAYFVTTQSTNDITKSKRAVEAREQGIALEVIDLGELAYELSRDPLHRFAEYELGVRPRAPRTLQTVPSYVERSLPAGASAPIVGRGEQAHALETLLRTATSDGRAAVVVVEGVAGVGKTRLALEAGPRIAVTVVASRSVRLDRDALVDIPLDGRAVLVVDDAHRCPDLSGLAAMLNDRAFDRVAVVLTVRPGLAERVLGDLGREPGAEHTLRLDPVSDSEIDQIVCDYGLHQDAFRNHVARAAAGIRSWPTWRANWPSSAAGTTGPPTPTRFCSTTSTAG